jgi:hypothetical protein
MSKVDIAGPTIKLNPAALVSLREAIRGRRRAVWVAHLDCRARGPIHSTDRLLHYHGNPQPDRLCGYHAVLDGTIGHHRRVALAQLTTRKGLTVPIVHPVRRVLRMI